MGAIPARKTLYYGAWRTYYAWSPKFRYRKLATDYARAWLLMSVQLFNAPPPNNKDLKEIREMQALTRAGRLRGFGRFIPETSFKMRKEYFAGVRTGASGTYVVRQIQGEQSWPCGAI